MSEMIRDVQSPNLIDALESNMAAYYLSYGDPTGPQTVDAEDIAYVFTGIPDALFNGVYRARLRSDAVAATLANIHAAQAHWRMPLLWWMTPQAKPAGLAHEISRHGWTEVGQLPGMALELDTVDDDAPLSPGLRIERVADMDTLALWARIAGEGAGLGPEVIAALIRNQRAMGLHPPMLTNATTSPTWTARRSPLPA